MGCAEVFAGELLGELEPGLATDDVGTEGFGDRADLASAEHKIDAISGRWVDRVSAIGVTAFVHSQVRPVNRSSPWSYFIPPQFLHVVAIILFFLLSGHPGVGLLALFVAVDDEAGGEGVAEVEELAVGEAFNVGLAEFIFGNRAGVDVRCAGRA